MRLGRPLPHAHRNSVLSARMFAGRRQPLQMRSAIILSQRRPDSTAWPPRALQPVGPRTRPRRLVACKAAGSDDWAALFHCRTHCVLGRCSGVEASTCALATIPYPAVVHQRGLPRAPLSCTRIQASAQDVEKPNSARPPAARTYDDAE